MMGCDNQLQERDNMKSDEQMVASVQAYVDGFNRKDPAAVVRLFATKAVLEDPVGTPQRRGLDEIRAFYTSAMETGAKLSLDGPVRTAGNSAAFAFSVRLAMGGRTHQIDVIDLFAFDDDGKIVDMRAFWGPRNVHEV
jgi:steroid Delta-isomerase